MFKLFCAVLIVLLHSTVAAQHSSDSDITDTVQGVLLPGSVSAATVYPGNQIPAQESRTGTLLLFPRRQDSNEFLQTQGHYPPELIVTGSYAGLQKILQQRDLLFWQIPLWTVTINLMSALVLMLVSLKQSGLPLFRWLLAIALTGNFYFLPQLASSATQSALAAVLAPAGTAVWLYLLYRLVQNIGFWRTDAPDRASRFLGYAVLLIMVLFVVDCASLFLDVSLPNHPGMSPQLVPFGQLTGIVAALYFLVSRHAETSAELENLNASLDQRVKLASAELQERYAQLKQDALDAASMKERKNIYQSIHEDLSDKLLQLIYSATLPETADLARSALSELRDSRNLLPDQQRPLDDLLADVLNEIQIRCDQANLQLTWQQLYQEKNVLLNARQCSALSRTLREAISNLLKHAKARSATISIDIVPGPVLIYHVQDDGAGMIGMSRPGRGLINMQNRIHELGGSLTISSPESGGTLLEFKLPLGTDTTTRTRS